MPYKDPAKRAAYMREYKGRGKPGNPCKCYFCPQYTSFNITSYDIRFRNGFFLTDNPALQEKIESHEYYGKYIFSWRVDPCPG